MNPATVALAVLTALALGWLALLWVAERGRVAPAPGDERAPRGGSRLAPPHLGQFLVTGAVGLLAYAVLGLAAPALVLAVMAWGATVAGRRWREARRRAALGHAILSAVDLLGQLLPAGHSTRQALVVLAESGPVELRPEIRGILRRLEQIPLEDALIEAQGQVRQPLFTLVASALIIGNRSGGRVAPLLQELGRAAHQIDAVQGQLRAEQAQGRLGALVIAVMPLVLLAVMHLVNPEYLQPYSSVSGELLLGGLLGLIVVGYLWMLHILRLPEPDLLPLAPQPRGKGAADAFGPALDRRSEGDSSRIGEAVSQGALFGGRRS
ncbi:MAG: type II secretion system F family protein [Candidatus Dormibacteria bacterium]